MVLYELFLYQLKILIFFYDQNILNKNNTYDDLDELIPNLNLNQLILFLNFHKLINFLYNTLHFQYNKTNPYQIK